MGTGAAAAGRRAAAALLICAASASAVRRSRASARAGAYSTEPLVLRCPENGTLTLPSGARVVDAWYGAQNDPERRLNVTQEVRFRYEFTGRDIHALNSEFGDPAFGIAKELEVMFIKDEGGSEDAGTTHVDVDDKDVHTVTDELRHDRGLLVEELRQQQRAAEHIASSESRSTAEQRLRGGAQAAVALPVAVEESRNAQGYAQSGAQSTHGESVDAMGPSRDQAKPGDAGKTGFSFCSQEGWQHEWADEFEGDHLDLESWKVVTSNGGHRTDSVVEDLNITACRRASCREENVRVSGGSLRLISQRGDSPFEFFSGAVTTRGRRAWADGSPYRLCVRARLPKGSTGSKGIWPAIWMLPDNGYSDRCLDEGEVDIMEMINGDGTVYSTYHWMSTWPAQRCADFNSGHRSKNGQTRLHGTWDSEFHEFAIERTADHIIFAVDGRPVQTVEPSMELELSHSPFFLILNTAIGGAWPGDPDGFTSMPTEHAIDYVRVVRRPNIVQAKQEEQEQPDNVLWQVGLFQQQQQIKLPACFYINLPSREDRVWRLREQLQMAGVVNCHRQEAVDARVLNVSGREGCRRSHLAALGEIEASGAPWGLVLEDDVQWRFDWNITMSQVRTFFHKVNESIVDHPILLLSCNGRGENISGQPWLQKVQDCQTTSAYIIRRDYIPVLRDLWDQASDTNPIDILWKTIQVHDNWAMANPLLLYQGMSFSDIEKRFVDYGVFLQH